MYFVDNHGHWLSVQSINWIFLSNFNLINSPLPPNQCCFGLLATRCNFKHLEQHPEQHWYWGEGEINLSGNQCPRLSLFKFSKYMAYFLFKKINTLNYTMSVAYDLLYRIIKDYAEYSLEWKIKGGNLWARAGQKLLKFV